MFRQLSSKIINQEHKHIEPTEGSEGHGCTGGVLTRRGLLVYSVDEEDGTSDEEVEEEAGGKEAVGQVVEEAISGGLDGRAAVIGVGHNSCGL